MPPLTLYYAPQSRSMTVLWMLEEIGEPYELKVLNFDDDSMRAPEYLAINPMGKVPAAQRAFAREKEIIAAQKR